MGAVAIQELDPMVNEALTPAEPIEQKAAKEAVRDIPARVTELGGSEQQGQGLAEAMRLVLLGHNSQARRALAYAGYPDYAVDDIMRELEVGLKSAA